jgi:hypothetical protein
MASKTSTSKSNVVDRGTAGGKSYYLTDVTTLANGGVLRETYRSDGKGNKISKIQTVKVDGSGKIIEDTVNTSTATIAEQRDLKNPNSTLRNIIKTQVNKTATDLAGNNIDGTTKETIQKAAFGSGNDLLNDAQVTAASRPAASVTTKSNLKPEASAEGTRTQFPTLIHPADLGSSKQDVIRFDMHEYVPGELTQSGMALGFNSGTNNLGPSIGSVTLPIPSGITDQNKADWGSNSMTALDIAKADVAKTAIFDGLQEGATKFLDYVEKAKSNSGAVAGAVGNAFAAAAAGVDGQALLSRTTGMVMNPNMELLFKGPSLRPFSFKFKLAPRGQTEADNIIKIIRFFKQGGAPIRSKSNLFLKSPHVFRLTYIHRGEQGELHKKLNAFKTCALQGFGVNYTPTGNYATYQDGTMVAYDINMSFTEITPVFNDDYDLDDSFIGF